MNSTHRICLGKVRVDSYALLVIEDALREVAQLQGGVGWGRMRWGEVVATVATVVEAAALVFGVLAVVRVAAVETG